MKLKKLPEKEIEKLLVREIKEYGGAAYKFVSPGNAGVPDRIVFAPHTQQRPVFVELKSADGRLTALQKNQLSRLSELGQDVHVVQGLAGLKDFFEIYFMDDAADRVAERMKKRQR